MSDMSFESMEQESAEVPLNNQAEENIALRVQGFESIEGNDFVVGRRLDNGAQVKCRLAPDFEQREHPRPEISDFDPESGSKLQVDIGGAMLVSNCYRDFDGNYVGTWAEALHRDAAMAEKLVGVRLATVDIVPPAAGRREGFVQVSVISPDKAQNIKSKADLEELAKIMLRPATPGSKPFIVLRASKGDRVISRIIRSTIGSADRQSVDCDPAPVSWENFKNSEHGQKLLKFLDANDFDTCEVFQGQKYYVGKRSRMTFLNTRRGETLQEQYKPNGEEHFMDTVMAVQLHAGSQNPYVTKLSPLTVNGKGQTLNNIQTAHINEHSLEIALRRRKQQENNPHQGASASEPHKSQPGGARGTEAHTEAEQTPRNPLGEDHDLGGDLSPEELESLTQVANMQTGR